MTRDGLLADVPHEGVEPGVRELWRRLEAFAARCRMKISNVVLVAVEGYLAEHDDAAPDQ